MKPKPGEKRSGLTLIEVMVGITVVVVGILGAMMYRYQAALHARKADVHVGAGRVALLVLEGWKGAAGNLNYDPSGDIPLNGDLVDGSADITISGTGPYTVKLLGGTDTNYYANLTSLDGATNDITGDGSNDPGLLKLTVDVTYYGRGSSDNSLPAKTVRISDFVRN